MVSRISFIMPKRLLYLKTTTCKIPDSSACRKVFGKVGGLFNCVHGKKMECWNVEMLECWNVDALAEISPQWEKMESWMVGWLDGSKKQFVLTED